MFSAALTAATTLVWAMNIDAKQKLQRGIGFEACGTHGRSRRLRLVDAEKQVGREVNLLLAIRRPHTGGKKLIRLDKSPREELFPVRGDAAEITASNLCFLRDCLHGCEQSFEWPYCARVSAVHQLSSPVESVVLLTIAHSFPYRASAVDVSSKCSASVRCPSRIVSNGVVSEGEESTKLSTSRSRSDLRRSLCGD